MACRNGPVVILLVWLAACAHAAIKNPVVEITPSDLVTEGTMAVNGVTTFDTNVTHNGHLTAASTLEVTGTATFDSNVTLGLNLIAGSGGTFYMNGATIHEVGDPVDDQDVATLAYTERRFTQFSQHRAAACITTANMTGLFVEGGTDGPGHTLTSVANQSLSDLLAYFDNCTYLDTLNTRLVVEQTAFGQSVVTGASGVGIYDITALGGADSQWVLTRSSDSDTNDTMHAGCYVFVTSGDTQTGLFYLDSPLTVMETSTASWVRSGLHITQVDVSPVTNISLGFDVLGDGTDDTAVDVQSKWTGSLGTTGYTIQEIVYALKVLGILAP